MLEFEITYKSSFCKEWPKLRIYNKNNLIKEVECSGDKFGFSFDPSDKNILIFDWYNKTEKHTKSTNGKITEDQTLELLNIRVDGIQIENWVMTDSHYEPRYFKGFVKQHQEQRLNHPLEKTLKSQLVWHFPGKFMLAEFTGDFWDWYFVKKQNKEVIKFLDKDPDRINKFRGSLDPCTELVANIKKII
jgi:hypothetical protein|tara:strand:+ start:233 stop:799 length:567 start_codon:yes stop_codon:yes gene_type:complete